MTEEKQTILLAIRPMAAQGLRLLGGQWPQFLQIIRDALAQVGVEEAESSDTLLLFSCGELHAALISWLECLGLLREQHWQKDWGPVPLQVIFHLQKKKEPPPEFRDASALVWDGVQQGVLHVSRGLKVQWDQLLAGEKLPAHRFGDDAEGGLAQLIFSEGYERVKRERLLAGRDLLVRGEYRECFYCGLRNHVPANCPSKHLTMETRGLSRTGYLPLAKIDAVLRQVMADPKKTAGLLADSPDAASGRKDPVLLVLWAYFDIFLIYQPRFLTYSAFSIFPNWDGVGKLARTRVDSRTLHSGLDCLRVGKYREAFDLLQTESQTIGGKQFYAAIGQAFVSLERGRAADMLQFLQMAASMAGTEKEKIYIALLLARFYTISGQALKAGHQMQSIAKLYADCQEISYRTLQDLAAEGGGQQFLQLLRKLAVADRCCFMAALMDPVLTPVSGLVDTVLSPLIEAKGREARKNLAEARTGYAELADWFAGEDEELLAGAKALERLEEQQQRGSYYDLLDVAQKSKTLAVSFPRLREQRLDDLNIQVDEAVFRWMEYDALWQGYPYQTFFRDFQEVLSEAKKMFVEARSCAGDNLAHARERLEQGKACFPRLEEMSARLQRLGMLLDTLKVFLGKLIITEVAFSAVALFALPLVILLGGDTLGPDFLALLKNPVTQKKGMFVINMLVAPFCAMLLTVRAMTRR